MERDKIIIVALVIVAIVICCVIADYALSNQSSEVLRIDDIDIKQDQFGIYNLEGHITPLKDFDYLDARIVFYDENNTIIGKSVCAWNMVNVKKDSSISLGDSLGGVCDGTPSYAVVEFYDSVTGNTPIANVTVEFSANSTHNNTDDKSVSVSTGSNNSDNTDKKYTQEDLNRAHDEGYRDGYDTSYSDSYYQDDSSSAVESGQNMGINREYLETHQPNVKDGSLE